MDPVGLTLIFPESYLNNPASMFGHTLLRIEQNDDRSALLAPSVSFSAVTEEHTGFSYAVKGLMGGYSGKFSQGMYVDQVRTYGAIENRDVYEYLLNVTPRETEFLLLHVWELKRGSFDYYFIDENCSYQLLALLEVARPSLELTSHAEYIALPVETIRLIVAAEPGMLQEVHYRPSRRSSLQRATENFPQHWLDHLQALGTEGVVTDDAAWKRLHVEAQAVILEAAIELVLYNQAVTTGKTHPDDPVLQVLLEKRSRLVVNRQVQSTNDQPVRPDQGHGTARAAFRTGVDASAFFIEAGFRPVLHDLLDPGAGYVNGAQVNFLSTALRYYPEQGVLKLQALDLINIVSLASRDRIIQPVSWLAKVGVEQMRYAEVGDRLTGRGKVGFGINYDFLEAMRGYLFMEGEVLLSDQFDNGINSEVGPMVGIHGGDGERWNFILQAKAGYSLIQQEDWLWSLQYILALHLTSEISLRFAFTREQEFAAPSSEAMFSLLWYF
jgi:hypothetical protein